MARFERIVTTLEAEQFTGIGPDPVGVRRDAEGPFVVTTHGQRTAVVPGDWIAPEPDANGHYPIKPHLMEGPKAVWRRVDAPGDLCQKTVSSSDFPQPCLRERPCPVHGS